jgi:hypothetical protein
METVTMESVEQTIANIWGRDVELEVDGQKIIASEPLLPDEQKVLQENRAEAIEIIKGRELKAHAKTIMDGIVEREKLTQDAAEAHERCERCIQDGYQSGIRDALEQAKEAPVAAPVPVGPAPTTPDREMERFDKWQHQRTEYYQWEPECLQALREALVEGDRLMPLFAYSCVIVHADGTEVEFKRVPKRKRS